MNLEFIPLLAAQRELYRIPRGPARFGPYVRMMRDDPEAAPLVALNPMARDHVPALIDALIGLDADRLAAEAVNEAAALLADEPGEYRIGLVVADDVGGGWTNRWACEHAWAAGSPAAIRRGWLAGVLWSSEPASARAVREAVLTPIHRAAHVQRHGQAKTLREFLAQEGRALADAGCEAPTLDADDLEYTRSVLEPHLDESLTRTVMECLYGDEAGRTLGFTPRGLSPRAGLALALHQARREGGAAP
ncbi:hypothetical protein [Paludisphaera soli]|uniref:hypothetical protein n=1 Tax=Paludisphaera soli TaxID=2712865 RepID=UPI0013ED3F13|nr:hypothetical protein [Paludisphaera soli]